MTDRPSTPSRPSVGAATPPWRDVRVLGALTQAAVLGAVGVVAWFLVGNLLGGMSLRGLSFAPTFLGTTAGFEIAETTISYTPTDTYARALLAGLANTLLVAVLGIVLSTILGVLAGVARLSSNWLLSRLTAGYVELFRNTPLLVQLFLLYFVVFLQLPAVRDSIVVGDAVYLNQRGISLPRPMPAAGAEVFLVALAAGIGLAVAVRRWASRPRADVRRLPGSGWLALAVLVALPAFAWLVQPAPPFGVDVPVRGTFNVRGGLTVTPEFAALLLSLVLYTSAFIAEIVRGGIQAVPRGQIEAAHALGLSDAVVLRRVVLPQAMRVIVPPLTSQYLNLLKNSSLAIAIGYPDLFNVSTTVANQTGQPVAVMGLVMVTYLLLSLLGSAIMGVVNRRVQLRER